MYNNIYVVNKMYRIRLQKFVFKMEKQTKNQKKK